MTAAAAAAMLEVTLRPVRRMQVAYRAEGVRALAHGNRGRVLVRAAQDRGRGHGARAAPATGSVAASVTLELSRQGNRPAPPPWPRRCAGLPS